MLILHVLFCIAIYAAVLALFLFIMYYQQLGWIRIPLAILLWVPIYFFFKSRVLYQPLIELMHRIRIASAAPDKFVLYLRPFDSDGDSAYPFQPGSRNSLRDASKRLDTDKTLSEDEAARLAAHLSAKMYFKNRGGNADPYIGSSLWGLEYEEQIAFATRQIGRCITLKNDEQTTAAAIERRRVNREWQSAAQDLMSSAELVVVRPGSTPAIQWEMRQIRDLQEPGRVLLFFPVNAVGYREDNYKGLIPVVEQQFLCELPEQIDADVAVFRFDNDWKPIPVSIKEGGRLVRLWGRQGAKTAAAIRLAIIANGFHSDRAIPWRAVLNMPLNLTMGCLYCLLLAFIVLSAVSSCVSRIFS